MRPTALGRAVRQPAPLPPLPPVERTRFDYSDLEAAMTYVDQVLRETRRSLRPLLPPAPATTGAQASETLVLGDHSKSAADTGERQEPAQG